MKIEIQSPVILGQRVYCIYDRISIISESVFAIGEDRNGGFFLLNPFNDTLEDSWRWDFSKEGEDWFTDPVDAKVALWEIAKEDLEEGETIDDLELVEVEENYWEIINKESDHEI